MALSISQSTSTVNNEVGGASANSTTANQIGQQQNPDSVLYSNKQDSGAQNAAAKFGEANFAANFLKASLSGNKSTGVTGNKLATQPETNNSNDKPDVKKAMTPETKLKGGEVNSGYDINKIPGVKNNPNVTPEFINKVNSIAKELNTPPEVLLSIMSYETINSFKPDKTNSNTGATGIIQFIPSTARGLLTARLANKDVPLQDKEKLIENLPFDKSTKSSLKELVNKPAVLKERKSQIESKLSQLRTASDKTAKDLKRSKAANDQDSVAKLKAEQKSLLEQSKNLKSQLKSTSNELSRVPDEIKKAISPEMAQEAFKNMSAIEQLDFVKDFFKPFKGKLNTPQDAYLAVLYPAAVGKGDQPGAIAINSNGKSETERRGYLLNRHFDKDHDGVITVKEATQEIINYLSGAKIGR